MTEPRVDLDLDDLRPPNSTFRHRGVVYEVPADLAVETIIESLQLRDKFASSQQEQNAARDNKDLASAAEQEMTAAMEELRGIIHNLMDEAKPGQTKPRLSIDEITAVMTLAMGGSPGQTPEETVKDGIVGEPDPDDDDGEGAGDPTASASAPVAIPLV